MLLEIARLDRRFNRFDVYELTLVGATPRISDRNGLTLANQFVVDDVWVGDPLRTPARTTSSPLDREKGAREMVLSSSRSFSTRRLLIIFLLSCPSVTSCSSSNSISISSDPNVRYQLMSLRSSSRISISRNIVRSRTSWMESSRSRESLCDRSPTPRYHVMEAMTWRLNAGAVHWLWVRFYTIFRLNTYEMCIAR